MYKGYAEENVVAHFFRTAQLTKAAEISVVVPGCGGDPAI